jgi:acetylornithine deacetylase/succinyl-diaminopimelate desuccinylase-like protein
MAEQWICDVCETMNSTQAVSSPLLSETRRIVPDDGRTANQAARQALAFAKANSNRFIRELHSFLRFPSVSAQSKHAMDVSRCAEWLAKQMMQSGLQSVRVVRTAGHPIVYGEWKGAPGRSTLLIYGHYDVQPADPLSEWKNPPFQPVIREGSIYARGASDDKGQMFAHLKGVEAWLRSVGRLPLNVKCIFEGEEEVGSKQLTEFLHANSLKLAPDFAVLSDMPMIAPDRPAITYSLRGSLALELEVRNAQRDLHSGLYGGAVLNPIQVLGDILASMHDRNGRVTIPGFYQDVREWPLEEREYMARVSPGEESMKRHAAVASAWGEPDYTAFERTTIRPALTFNGITGGYQGEGSKSIVPASARAKISFRLAPDQNPTRVEAQFVTHVRRMTPRGVHLRIKTESMSAPVSMSRKHPMMKAAAESLRRAFGHPAAFVRCGGTIPVVNTLQQELRVPTVLMGLALPDDGMHGPNERFRIATFLKGITASVWFLNEVGRLNQARHQRRVQQP